MHRPNRTCDGDFGWNCRGDLVVVCLGPVWRCDVDTCFEST